jgi:glycerol-3-phosphate dehydrogenase
VEDSRLVVLNALDAAERGAGVHPRLRLVSARVEHEAWVAECIDHVGRAVCFRARAIANATGAWVNDCLGRCGVAPRAAVRLVKGSHLVFPRLYDGEHAYLLQNADRRVVFLIPYERDFTLVGTTDVPYTANPATPAISAEEAQYLCECASHFLRARLAPGDAVASYSGVRPLHDDGSASEARQVSRDYRLELQHDVGAPILSVYGGKITTYRRLAEHALQLLLPALGLREDDGWTDREPLPGGDIADGDLARFTRDAQVRWHGIDAALVGRLARSYGTRTARVLGAARTVADLGGDLGLGLTRREVDYLVDQEWARTPDDVLARRSRLGLKADAALKRGLEDYFSTNARSMT